MSAAHPRVVRQYVLATLFCIILGAYIVGVTLVILQLSQGASLRLIALCVLFAPAILVLEIGLWLLYIMPEWIKWRDLMLFWHWPQEKTLRLWMRVKYGKQRPGIYTPVSSTNRQIRLLVVHAGEEQEEVRCSLLPVYLGDRCPKYEALSYTWGHGHSPCHIVLNESPFTVTSNLFGALKRLRRNYASRALWVDALSIDQSNILERGEQVTLMRLIYACASNVIIWLGEDYNSSRHAMELLCSASEQIDPHAWLSDRLKTTFWSDTTQWKALLSLFKREYWSRTWIIQETAVAKDLDIFCGNLSCKWEVAVVAHNVWISFRAVAASRKQQDLIDSMEDFTEAERTTFSWTLIPRNTGPATLSVNRNNVLLSRTSSLISLLQENWTAEASDPRDKIFALLGLATDCQTPTLSADYSLSQWETYLQTMSFLLENFGNLDVIAYSGIHLFNASPWWYRAPSWTPTFYWGWEAPSTGVYSQYLYKFHHNSKASNDRKAVATFLPRRKPFDRIFGVNRAVLRAQICRIDRVSRCLYNPSNACLATLNVELTALKKKLHIDSSWLAGMRFSIVGKDRDLVDDIRILYHYFVLDGELTSHDQSAQGKLERERRTETLWRSLIMNRSIDGTMAPNTWSSLFAVIVGGPSLVPADFEAPQSGLSANERAIAYIQPFLQAARQLEAGKRSLFKTDCGRLVVANYGARMGDHVCIILGCNMPMIMRERRTRKGDVEAELYGAAYMHEYMQGKAIEELESGQLALETIDFV